MTQPTILVVEDDVCLREALVDTLRLSDYDVRAAADGREALDFLDRHSVQLVISDVQMKPMDGIEFLKEAKSKNPSLPVVLMTAYGTIERAVQAMHAGAADYLVKPFDADALVAMAGRLISATATACRADDGLVAVDKTSTDIVNLARRVAATEATVMIGGESGTGKEVIARFIHRCSKRAKGPFVAINCAAIPENMLEAVLFGYEKGAFTGAYQTTPGKFEQAQGGTLLLDEISEMDLGLQAKLLRVLQEREVERLGGRKTIALDVRVLATSNRNLKEQVAKGLFREDLYYRLNVFPINLKPLRSRAQDIVPLAEALIARRTAPGNAIPRLSDEVKAMLSDHAWPGNVRELDNVLQRALILMSGNEITPVAIHLEHVEHDAAPASASAADSGSLGGDLKVREHRLIIDALIAGNGSRKAAAEKLGISPRTLRYKLARMREEGVAIPV